MHRKHAFHTPPFNVLSHSLTLNILSLSLSLALFHIRMYYSPNFSPRSPINSATERNHIPRPHDFSPSCRKGCALRDLSPPPPKSSPINCLSISRQVQTPTNKSIGKPKARQFGLLVIRPLYSVSFGTTSTSKKKTTLYVILLAHPRTTQRYLLTYIKLHTQRSLAHLSAVQLGVKSGSLFYLSQDHKYVIKTLNRREFSSLGKLLPAYNRVAYLPPSPPLLFC